MNWIYNIQFMYCVGFIMVDLNKAFEEGISNLECDEKMGKFLEKVLKYELSLSDDKNSTQSAISEQYRKWIENSSEGD